MKKIEIFLCLLAAFCAVSGCTPEQGGDDGDGIVQKGNLSLNADRTVICADGTDAALFTVNITDGTGLTVDVTEDAEIYSAQDDELLEGASFSTSQVGEYSFYAVYGTSVSSEVGISALETVPQVPDDPQSDNLEFRHRLLLVQHTGAACPNCPLMMTSLKTLSENPEYSDSYNLCASHSYYDGLDDNAYSAAAKTLSATFCSGSYPELTFNLTNDGTGYKLDEIYDRMDAMMLESADAGIAMDVDTSGHEVIAKAGFKFGEDGDYRVGAWLLEDNIFSRQAGATESWQHYHGNALRLMYGERQTECIYGLHIGSQDKGAETEMFFRFPLEDDWKASECKVLAFVTVADAEGNFNLVNCVVCKVGDAVAYDYK